MIVYAVAMTKRETRRLIKQWKPELDRVFGGVTFRTITRSDQGLGIYFGDSLVLLYSEWWWGRSREDPIILGLVDQPDGLLITAAETYMSSEIAETVEEAREELFQRGALPG